MTIDCENCGESIEFNAEECVHCGATNSLKFEQNLKYDSEEQVEEEVHCIDCEHYHPENAIQCLPMAKRHKWDRPTFELDDVENITCPTAIKK